MAVDFNQSPFLNTLNTISPPSRSRAVKWECLPETNEKPKWYEVEKTRNLVSNVFFALSILAASAAAPFIASPLFLVAIPFGTLSLLLAVGGIYLRCMKENKCDPASRMKIRESIKTQQETPHVKTLNSHVANFIITSDEKQILLNRDIFSLDYVQFVTKHGHEVLKDLDDMNLADLRIKFLESLRHCELTDENSILESSVNRFFRFGKNELTPFVIKPAPVEETPIEAEVIVNKPAPTMYSYLATAGTYAIPVAKMAIEAMLPPAFNFVGKLALNKAEDAFGKHIAYDMIDAGVTKAVNVGTPILINKINGKA